MEYLETVKIWGWALARDNTILVASPFIVYVKKDPTFTWKSIHFLLGIYRRTSFNCENLIIADCKFF